MNRGGMVQELHNIADFLAKAKAFLEGAPGGQELAREAGELAQKIPQLSTEVKNNWKLE